MLASDNTTFPLYLDELSNLDERCSNSLYLDEASCGDNGFLWLNYQDSLSSIDVNNISFQSIDNNDDRAYYVEFFGQAINGNDYLMIWIIIIDNKTNFRFC